MVDLIKSLAELGVGAVLGGVAIYILSKIITRQFDEAKEDREQNRQVQSEVANALNNLADAHRVQERTVREAVDKLGERPKQDKQATS